MSSHYVMVCPWCEWHMSPQPSVADAETALLTHERRKHPSRLGAEARR